MPSGGSFFLERKDLQFLKAMVYSYCECDPIGNHDSEGNTSWNKALEILHSIGAKAKELLDYIVDSTDFILGIKTDVDWKIFSKIASEVIRSPHKVKQVLLSITDTWPHPTGCGFFYLSYDTFENSAGIVRGDGMGYALQYNAFHKLEAIGVTGKDAN